MNQLINEFEPFDRCRTIVTEVICVYRYPACSNITGRLLPICTYICQGIESVIVDCSLESFGYPTVSQIVNSFDCLDPQTYFTDFPDDYIEDDPSECSLPGNYLTVCIYVAKGVVEYGTSLNLLYSLQHAKIAKLRS